MIRARTIFVTKERRVWMRLESHTVVFDRDPDFARYSQDPSGAVIRILHLWLGEVVFGSLSLRHYLGSVRYSGGWLSRTELRRLYRRATTAARLTGEKGRPFRRRLSVFLRGYFELDKAKSGGLA